MKTKNAMNIRYFILGLLTRKPMSGYDIRVSLGSMNWLIDVPSYGSLYPALHSLLEKRLVDVNIAPKKGKRSRKVYSITETGSQALQVWIHQPIETNLSQKAFVMRLLLANNFSPEGLIEYLKQRNTQITVRHAELKHRIETDTTETGNESERLALDYGLAIASAEIEWLKETLVQLSENAQARIRQSTEIF